MLIELNGNFWIIWMIDKRKKIFREISRKEYCRKLFFLFKPFFSYNDQTNNNYDWLIKQKSSFNSIIIGFSAKKKLMSKKKILTNHSIVTEKQIDEKIHFIGFNVVWKRKKIKIQWHELRVCMWKGHVIHTHTR